MSLLKRNIYEISSTDIQLTGVKLRGRIRKYCIQNQINIIIDNASDVVGSVRFGIIDDKNLEIIHQFVKSIVGDVTIKKVLNGISNPVLSKLKVNDESRYEI